MQQWKSANVWLFSPDKLLEQNKSILSNKWSVHQLFLCRSWGYSSSLLCAVRVCTWIVFFHALCLPASARFLKASTVPVALLPFLPQRSERQLLFCCVPMSFRRKRTRQCCRPRSRASGRTTSGCRRSRRAQWPASSKSPSCCATSTSPVSFTAAHTKQKSADWCKSYDVLLRSTYFYCSCIAAKVNAHNYSRLCPEAWTCLLVKEYANQILKEKKRHYQKPHEDIYTLTSTGCCASSGVCVCVCVYVRGCVCACSLLQILDKFGWVALKSIYCPHLSNGFRILRGEKLFTLS